MAVTQASATEVALDSAAAACARRGAQLTELRRQVLRLILESDGPVGAYALLDRLKALRGGAAPPTVYRALDFLLEQGLIHRVERLNAFVGCVEPAQDHTSHDHPHQFLICRGCGRTVELADPSILSALAAAAAGVGFTAERMTVEVEGVCAGCTAPS